MENKNIAVLSIGANIGDKVNNFKKVVDYIASYIGIITKQSTIYESKAWGFDSDDNFLNQVLIVETTLKSEELLTTIWKIERLFGRERGSVKCEVDKYKTRKNSDKPIYLSRCMDIDILFYNDEIINTDLLSIPHTFVDKREFILIPLVEILPNYIHPQLNITLKDILINLNTKC